MLTPIRAIYALPDSNAFPRTWSGALTVEPTLKGVTVESIRTCPPLFCQLLGRGLTRAAVPADRDFGNGQNLLLIDAHIPNFVLFVLTNFSGYRQCRSGATRQVGCAAMAPKIVLAYMHLLQKEARKRVSSRKGSGPRSKNKKVDRNIFF
jgi:hypothetical protein